MLMELKNLLLEGKNNGENLNKKLENLELESKENLVINKQSFGVLDDSNLEILLHELGINYQEETNYSPQNDYLYFKNEEENILLRIEINSKENAEFDAKDYYWNFNSLKVLCSDDPFEIDLFESYSDIVSKETNGLPEEVTIKGKMNYYIASSMAGLPMPRRRNIKFDQWYNKSNQELENNIENLEECKNKVDEKIKEKAKEIEELLRKKIEYREYEKYSCELLELKKKEEKIENYIENLKEEDKLNTWRELETKYRREVSKEFIENGTFSFEIVLSKRESYYQDEPFYETSYIFRTNKILPNSEIIKSVDKKFTNGGTLEEKKENALDYIEGRKKAYSKYFKEEKPAVMSEYADNIKMYGRRLAGYRVEE